LLVASSSLLPNSTSFNDLLFSMAIKPMQLVVSFLPPLRKGITSSLLSPWLQTQQQLSSSKVYVTMDNVLLPEKNLIHAVLSSSPVLFFALVYFSQRSVIVIQTNSKHVADRLLCACWLSLSEYLTRIASC